MPGRSRGPGLRPPAMGREGRVAFCLVLGPTLEVRPNVIDQVLAAGGCGAAVYFLGCAAETGQV